MTPSSSSSFILKVCPSWGTFHDSVSKFGLLAGSPCCYFLCMSDLGLQWWDVLARLGSTSQCLVMLSFFFLTIHESKSWKWRIEPLTASYQFKDSFFFAHLLTTFPCCASNAASLDLNWNAWNHAGFLMISPSKPLREHKVNGCSTRTQTPWLQPLEFFMGRFPTKTGLLEEER